MYSLGCKLIKVGWVPHFSLLKDTHFVWLEAVTMLVKNPINIFLINPGIILYYFEALNIGEY